MYVETRPRRGSSFLGSEVSPCLNVCLSVEMPLATNQCAARSAVHFLVASILPVLVVCLSVCLAACASQLDHFQMSYRLDIANLGLS